MTAPYYSDDLVTLYHGNAEDILPTLTSVDVVITDPPYSEHTHSSVRSAKMMANDRGGVLRCRHTPERGSRIRRPNPGAARVLRYPVRSAREAVGARVL